MDNILISGVNDSVPPAITLSRRLFLIKRAPNIIELAADEQAVLVVETKSFTPI